MVGLVSCTLQHYGNVNAKVIGTSDTLKMHISMIHRDQLWWKNPALFFTAARKWISALPSGIIYQSQIWTTPHLVDELEVLYYGTSSLIHKVLDKLNLYSNSPKRCLFLLLAIKII